MPGKYVNDHLGGFLLSASSRVLYEWLSWRMPGPEALNYGYAPATGSLQLALYQHLLDALPAPGSEHPRVIEIGCAMAVGGDYVARTLKASYVGIDRSRRSIALCKKTYPAEMRFLVGLASALPIQPGFDIAINVESSHAYPSMPEFLTEVERVLLPGGHFLWADFRPDGSEQAIRQQFADARLSVLALEDITQNVVDSLDQDVPRKEALLASICNSVSGPERWLMRAFNSELRTFAGMPGTSVYEDLLARRKRYLKVIAVRP